jgi:hypothetical protein
LERLGLEGENPQWVVVPIDDDDDDDVAYQDISAVVIINTID